MVPQINISESLFEKIKALAEPFIDTPESVLTRCVEEYASSRTRSEAGSGRMQPNSGAMAPTKSAEMQFPPDLAPDLTFTHVVSISVAGKEYAKKDRYWNTVMFDVVARAAEKLKSKEKVMQLIPVNYVDGVGPKERGGFRYIEEGGFSVQGQDSNAAWKTIFHIAKALGWTEEQAKTFSLSALRDIVRPVSPDLAAELGEVIRDGSHIRMNKPARRPSY